MFITESRKFTVAWKDKQTCHERVESCVLIPSKHIKSQKWLCTFVTGVVGQRQDYLGLLAAILASGSVRDSVLKEYCGEWQTRTPDFISSFSFHMHISRCTNIHMDMQCTHIHTHNACTHTWINHLNHKHLACPSCHSYSVEPEQWVSWLWLGVDWAETGEVGQIQPGGGRHLQSQGAEQQQVFIWCGKWAHASLFLLH